MTDRIADRNEVVQTNARISVIVDAKRVWLARTSVSASRKRYAMVSAAIRASVLTTMMTTDISGYRLLI